MKIVITGGNGFIGHHFCEHILKNTDWDISIIDKLSYASLGYERLRDVQAYDNKRIKHFTHDFTHPITDFLSKEIGDPDYIVHMGAETHVDNSIVNPEPFVMSNVVGTMHLLNWARKCLNLKKFIYFSTDEVFGPAPQGFKGYKEWDRYKSSNPYAASKAGGEELCIAWHNTYKLPVVVTHTMNVFGERQHFEKFIPNTIKKVLSGDTVIIHSNKEKTKAGSRFYIHARNVASSILFLLQKSVNGDKYNIVGDEEVDNLQLAQIIADEVGKELKYQMLDFHSSRPGHDLRYALDGDKLIECGHIHPKNFKESLSQTIQWTLNNSKWLGHIDMEFKPYDSEHYVLDGR